MRLHELHDNPGAARPRKRKGRGPGSGVGKTGGRGQKGQKSRSGHAAGGFEGGQMPLYQRLPKRGFKRAKANINILNIKDIERAIETGRLDRDKIVDERALVECRLVRRVNDGTKLLGKGDLTHAIRIKIWDVSSAAKQKVEQAGGIVYTTCVVSQDRGREDRAARWLQSHRLSAVAALGGEGVLFESELKLVPEAGSSQVLLKVSFDLQDKNEAMSDELWLDLIENTKIVVSSDRTKFDFNNKELRDLITSKSDSRTSVDFTGNNSSDSADDIFVLLQYKNQIVELQHHKL